MVSVACLTWKKSSFAVPQRPPPSTPMRQLAGLGLSRVPAAPPYRYHSRPPPRLTYVRFSDRTVACTDGRTVVAWVVGSTERKFLNVTVEGVLLASLWMLVRPRSTVQAASPAWLKNSSRPPPWIAQPVSSESPSGPLPLGIATPERRYSSVRIGL